MICADVLKVKSSVFYQVCELLKIDGLKFEVALMQTDEESAWAWEEYNSSCG